MFLRSFALLALLAFAFACSATKTVQEEASACSCDPVDPAPQATISTAVQKETKPAATVNPHVARAEAITLEARKPADAHGLHNLFKLSERFVSGSEPHGEEAFAELAKMGVKTIVSVDSKFPDSELAAKYGMRYVHVPFGYHGIGEDDQMRLATAYKQCDGPFYVHCFHGKHRGPAAIALGRILLDGVSKETALAEMKQWCGTSPKYTGLYETVDTYEAPTEAAIKEFNWTLSDHAEVGDVAGNMVQISRADDALKLLEKVGYAADPHHPDLDALNEAVKLEQAFDEGIRMATESGAKEDYIGWMKTGKSTAADVKAAIEDMRAGRVLAAKISELYKQVDANCNACHVVYRNTTPILPH